MKKLFFYAAALLAAISFSACSDDDENGLSATPENIAGTWQIVSETGFEIDNGQTNSWSEQYPDEDGRYYTRTFNMDGTFDGIDFEYDEDSGAYTQNRTGRYSISGNTLITVNDDSDEPAKYEIKKLTESQLVLLDKYEEPDYSFEDTLTFKRIE